MINDITAYHLAQLLLLLALLHESLLADLLVELVLALQLEPLPDAALELRQRLLALPLLLLLLVQLLSIAEDKSDKSFGILVFGTTPHVLKARRNARDTNLSFTLIPRT